MKTCDSCIHSIPCQEGDGWNEPYYFWIECEHMESASENTAYSVETTLEKDNAEGCPLYDGGKCEICGRNIKSDEVLFVPDMYSEWRCCSVECKEKIEEKLRKDREEELKILARYQG